MNFLISKGNYFDKGTVAFLYTLCDGESYNVYGGIVNGKWEIQCRPPSDFCTEEEMINDDNFYPQCKGCKWEDTFDTIDGSDVCDTCVRLTNLKDNYYAKEN